MGSMELPSTPTLEETLEDILRDDDDLELQELIRNNSEKLKRLLISALSAMPSGDVMTIIEVVSGEIRAEIEERIRRRAN